MDTKAYIRSSEMLNDVDVAIEFRPCLCGGTPDIITEGNGTKIECPRCGSATQDEDEFSEAVVAWNRINMTDDDIIQESLDICQKRIIKNGGEVDKKYDHFEVFNFKAEKRDDSYKAGFVYIAHTVGTNNYKIGSAKDVTGRYLSLRVGNPHLAFIATKQSMDRKSDEKMLHKIFADSRISGEWFALTSEQLIDAISKYGFNYCIEAPSEK